MVYVIAGVSGNVGKVAAETLLGEGKQVRVLVRDAAKGDAWAKRGAEVAIADLADASSLSQALIGASAAFLLIPPNFAVAEFSAYQRRVADSMAQAVSSSKLPHLVLLSSLGAQLAHGTGPIKGLHYAEGLLREQKHTKSTFLRASYFMENLGSSLSALDQGVLPVYSAASYPFDMVATVDIGKAVGQLIQETPAATQVVNLAGPKRSFDDAARVLSELVKKPIRTLEAPTSTMAAALQQFGVPKELSELYQEMTEGFASGLVQFEPEHRKLEGKTDLEVVLRALLAQGAR